MMDIENYKGAVASLRRNLAEFRTRPNDPTIQCALLQSFEVTYNLSEAILREAYGALGTDENAAYVSLPELIRRASEDGIVLSCRKDWLRYGLALETMRDSLCVSAGGNFGDVTRLLSRFADDLESFAHCLERRVAHNG